MFQCKVMAIDKAGLIYKNREGEQGRVDAEHIVLALGMKPGVDMVENLQREGYSAIALEYCHSQRSVYEFARQGALAARNI